MFVGFGMYDLFDIVFLVLFFMIFLVFLVAIVGGIVRWNKNNKSPRLTVPAIVVAKREDISDGSQHSGHVTFYYVTFQVESGDRMEFELSGIEYGSIAEGDEGRLSFQGSRFLSFDREY